MSGATVKDIVNALKCIGRNGFVNGTCDGDCYYNHSSGRGVVCCAVVDNSVYLSAAAKLADPVANLGDRAKILAAIHTSHTLDVVRCKDCRHYRPHRACSLEGDGEFMHIYPGDFYCADGERRTENYD